MSEASAFTPLRVFKDADCDLGLIRAQRVLVIGYGSQGRTHALNLRDSGVAALHVALKPGSPSRARSEADGFRVVETAAGVATADVIAVMVSDEGHQDLFASDILPHLRPGQALVFAHGLSVHFGLVTPPPGVDVILASPKGIGPRIRDLYVAGEGTFCLFAVHQDATGTAHALGLSYAAGLGCGRKAILETTFKDECECDLFGEQVVLCGGVQSLVDTAFETLVAAGYPPEVAWFECFYELKLVVDLMAARGIAGAFAKISNTAEYGAYLTGPRIINAQSVAQMQGVLRDVQSGDFVRTLMADYQAGSPDLLARRTRLGLRGIEAVGRHLGEGEGA